MSKPALRDFQLDDVANAVAMLAKHRRVLGRAATGLGKAVELAAIASHYMPHGRVLILVDVRKLVRQLARTVEWFTGVTPGVEMGDERADNRGGIFHAHDRVVVSTVQTMYSGPAGKERYREFDPKEFAIVLLDECELFLAPKSRSVVDYFYAGNPKLLVYGTTATPLRTDGVEMANLFDAVAFDRDILWGTENGWLVRPRQGWVRCVSLDFSSLKLREGEDGEKDYSESDLAAKLSEEGPLIELAKGIIEVAGDRKSIVVCPNDTAVAKAVAEYLRGERPGCARHVIGEMADEEKDAVMDAHARGEFQFLTSCMMLTKGYDDPSIRAVFNCRKTRSKRLYTQIMGRGTRPDRSVVEALNAAAIPADRIAIIAASAKPDTLMVNLVGIDEDVRDVTIIDILGKPSCPAVAEHAKQLMLADAAVTPEEAVAVAEEEAELERVAEQLRAERAAEALEQEERRARNIRERVQIGAAVEVEWQDDMRVGGTGGVDTNAPAVNGQNPAHVRIVRDQAKFPPEMVAAMSPDQLKRVVQTISIRRKQGLVWSYKVGKLLERIGYAKSEVHMMPIAAASAAIEAAKANGWQRPRTTEAA